MLSIQSTQVISRKQYVCWVWYTRANDTKVVHFVVNLLYQKLTILFCPATTEIRNAFWLRLLKRFGLRFYASFINNTPLRQLDMLFSGCYDLFEKWEWCFQLFKNVCSVFEQIQNCTRPRNYYLTFFYGVLNIPVYTLILVTSCWKFDIMSDVN